MWLVQVIGCLLTVDIIATIRTTENVPEHPKPYEFGYTVKADETGDYKTHHEVNNGQEVQGEYSLGEPNGDLRVVKYTADRANGFRAFVSVHPGASPVKPTESHETKKESRQNTEVISESDKSERNSKNPAGSGENIGPSSTDNQYHSENHQLKLNTKNYSNLDDISRNNATDSGVKIGIGSLFDILPGLDKHVPKIEYIVEEGYEDHDGVRSYLQNGDINIPDGPQVIPVKIQEDPYDKSLELVESDTSTKTSTSYSDGKNENQPTQTFDQQSTKDEASPTLSLPSKKDISSPNGTKTTVFNDKSQVKITPTESVLYTQDKVKVEAECNSLKIVKENGGINNKTVHNQNIKQTTTQPATEDSKSNLFTTIQDQTSAQSKVQTTNVLANYFKQDIIHKNVAEKNINGSNGIDVIKNMTKPLEAALKPDSNIILAALMIPTSMIKFTCTPDNLDKNGLKIKQTIPNVSPKFSGLQQGPAKIPLNDNGLHLHLKNPMRLPSMMPTNPSHLFNGMTFLPTSFPLISQSIFNKFRPVIGSEHFSTHGPVVQMFYNHTLSTTSSLNQQKTTPTPPTVTITPPTIKPHQRFRSEESLKNGNQNSVMNRHSPLYPIPYPWNYHPIRPPSRYHQRHLPVFVLPMSHNVNFARTFDPESYDKHNN